MRLGWKLFWLVVFVAAALQVVAMRDPGMLGLASITQPIAFNHKKHAGDLALPCTTCHQTVESQTFAGLPQTDTCMTCHAAALTKSPEEEKIRQYAAKGEKIPWNRIYHQPGYVFFSHRRHVVLGKVECATCHGKMVEQSAPPTHPLVKQTMQWCMACHEKRKVSLDCAMCHK